MLQLEAPGALAPLSSLGAPRAVSFHPSPQRLFIMTKSPTRAALIARLAERLIDAGVSPESATARATANAARVIDKAPAALCALREIDAPVYAWLVEVYCDGYAEVKGLDPAEWSGEHAASALDASVLEDQGGEPIAGRSWSDVYDAVIDAYNAVAPYKG